MTGINTPCLLYSQIMIEDSSLRHRLETKLVRHKKHKRGIHKYIPLRYILCMPLLMTFLCINTQGTL
nr:MAG TPA: hypothetical protein [Caudoviricetes sp.]